MISMKVVFRKNVKIALPVIRFGVSQENTGHQYFGLVDPAAVSWKKEWKDRATAANSGKKPTVSWPVPTSVCIGWLQHVYPPVSGSTPLKTLSQQLSRLAARKD